MANHNKQLSNPFSTSSWDFFFGLLCQYIEREGNAYVPRKYVTKGGCKLGQWVRAQQQSYKKRKLSAKRKERLEKLSKWVWDHSEALWQEGFNHLCKYADREGNTKVPVSYFTEDHYNLGTWVASQHAAYRKGTLSTKRQHIIEELPGWVWNRGKTRQMIISEGFLKRLHEYAKREGHTFVPVNYFTKDGYALGKWVVKLRQAYQQERLTTEQQKKLEQLPAWKWRTSHKLASKTNVNAPKWRIGFKHLREYAEREGHTNIPRSYVTPDKYNLGIWVQNQRQFYRKGILPKERQLFLEQLPVWKWRTSRKLASNTIANEEKWRIGFKHLRKYAKREGHTNVPVSYVTKDRYRLGMWVGTQRARYSQGNLSLQRRRSLERIPTWIWNVHELQWNEGFIHLLKYIGIHRHAIVSQNYKSKDGYKLGIWVMHQRRLYRRNQLSSRRCYKLERLYGWTWKPGKGHKNILWLKRFNRLSKYVELEGHALVPANYVTDDGYGLGTWVRDQRYKKKQGRLSEEQQHLFEQLSGWVWESTGHRGISWSQAYDLLKGFCEDEGHVRVHEHYKTYNGYALGLWVRAQRRIYKNDKLSKKKQELLEKLPGWVWDARKDRWPKGYKYLCNYAKNNGTSRVPNAYTTEDGYNLGTWVVNQKALKRKGLLTTERQRKLERLADWTWGASKKQMRLDWFVSFKYLLAFVDNEGHAKVPLKYITKDGYKLEVIPKPSEVG